MIVDDPAQGADAYEVFINIFYMPQKKYIGP